MWHEVHYFYKIFFGASLPNRLPDYNYSQQAISFQPGECLSQFFSMKNYIIYAAGVFGFYISM